MPSQEKKFATINVGDRAEFTVLISESLVNDFGRISGDENPLHMDNDYAAKTAFGQRVVHGMLGGAFISQLVGMHLPGKYALFLKQTLLFKKPMYIGMEVSVTGEVCARNASTRTIELVTQIKYQDEILVDGQALVQVTE